MSFGDAKEPFRATEASPRDLEGRGDCLTYVRRHLGTVSYIIIDERSRCTLRARLAHYGPNIPVSVTVTVTVTVVDRSKCQNAHAKSVTDKKLTVVVELFLSVVFF